VLSASAFAQSQSVRLPWNPEDGENAKPVMVHPNRPDILQANPFLREYWHLTNHYFYPKDSSGRYIYNTGIDRERFKAQYLDNEERRTKLDDHPKVKYRDVILNLEMLKLYKVDDPDWRKWTQQYIDVSGMIDAAGIPTAIYGTHHTGGAEFQIWYNIGRFEYRLDPERNPRYEEQKEKAAIKLKEYKQKETGLLKVLEKIRDRMSPHIDAVVLSCYMPYTAPSLDSEAWISYESYLQQCVSAYRLLYPNKPIYVFIQPSFTHSKPERFQPMSNEVWNATLKTVYENKDVDRVYIFSLLSKEMPENFFDSLLYGPE
jgi:hypothetical protein